MRSFAGPQWNREARPSRDILGHTSGSWGWPESSHPRQTARHADAGSRQLIEQHLRVLEIGGVEAFGKPVVNGREKFARLSPPALFASQPREARRGAQFKRFCLLLAGNAERILEGRLTFFQLVEAA